MTTKDGKQFLILIVDDQDLLQKMWRAYVDTIMPGKCQVFSALNNKQAEKIFYDHAEEIDIIVIDFDLGGGENTLPLIGKIRKDFQGLMIANSSDPENNRKLMRAGCDLPCRGKENLVKLLSQELQ